MSAFFWINPGIVVGCASLLGCLYFLCVCVDDARTLLTYWPRRSSVKHQDQIRSGAAVLLSLSAPLTLFYQQALKAMCGPALPADRLLPLLPLPPQAD